MENQVDGRRLQQLVAMFPGQGLSYQRNGSHWPYLKNAVRISAQAGIESFFLLSDKFTPARKRRLCQEFPNCIIVERPDGYLISWRIV
jgi:hypothetical protein